jgi:purine-cytosine permease-like protein
MAQITHSASAVPLEERSGPFTMGLLWITMVVFFPSLLIGFEWCKNGFSFWQVIGCSIISCIILLIYTVPSTQLGAQTGLGYISLSKGVFGRWGSAFVTINLIWIFTLFYGLGALFAADSFKALFHLNYPLAWLAAGLAIIMSFNNFFGFKGIANFARYVAAPLLIFWVFYSFFKTVSIFPIHLINEPSKQPLNLALTTISSYLIGYSVWGNEKDYWRFSIPKPFYAVIPLTVSLIIGAILFPITGWMIAKITGITESGAATTYLNVYSFGGIAWLGALVLGSSYFAANDSNLFANIQACESIKNLPHRTWVIIMAIISTVIAFLLSISGTAKALESIGALNCVIMPTPTVIMLTEWFLLIKIFKTKRISIDKAFKPESLPNVRLPAIIALVSGITIGLLTSGLIPGLKILHIGVCSLQAWLTAFVVYVPLRIIEHQQMVADHTDMLERVLAKRFEQASARLPHPTMV